MKEGFNNRRIDPLPTNECVMEVITNDVDGQHIDLCEWRPRTEDSDAGEGYIGTAKVIAGKWKGIGFHAWEQNDSEFLYYKLMSNSNFR